MKPIIEIRGLGKRYNITHRPRGYVALRDVLTEIGKRPFRFIEKKAKTALGRTVKEEFWALKDINLAIGRGEAVGIIGANGAGKSTLLKILSRITPPTEGEAILRGRVASLLEVGTGFHPELTGRENIFLNAAVLGMPRKEALRKFDEIVAFSGVEQFIDTPVKRYSSGMYVRLAFAVAAHIEPDILLIDEVLAVGDAEFQKKCLGKMDEVTHEHGRTVVFVSHNMDAVRQLCQKAVLIEHGRIAAIGPTEEVIAAYLTKKSSGPLGIKLPVDDGDVTLERFAVVQDGMETTRIVGEKPFAVSITFENRTALKSFRVGIFLKNALGTVLSRSFVQDYDSTLENLEPGRRTVTLSVPARLLRGDEYVVELKLFTFGIRTYFTASPIEKTITVASPVDYNELRSKNTDWRGYFLIPNAWQIDDNNK